MDPLFGDFTLPYALSVGIVRTGDWASSVPDRLSAEGRYGVRLDEDVAEARAALERAVAEAAARDPWLRDHRPQVTWDGGQFASGRLPADHPLIEEVATAAADTHGARPVAAAGPYGSDLRLLLGLGGIPTLQYGPGAAEDAHAPRERVSIQETLDVARSLLVLAAPALRRRALTPGTAAPTAIVRHVSVLPEHEIGAMRDGLSRRASSRQGAQEAGG